MQRLNVEIRAYREADFDGINALWQEAFPDDSLWNLAENAIPAKIAFQRDLLFVARDSEEIVGSIMAGYDGHRGWLYAVAVRSTHQRSGLGAMLVRHAESELQNLGCCKINLQVRSTNAAVVKFYQRLGYTVEDRVSLGRQI